jgi:hypothetical protein
MKIHSILSRDRKEAMIRQSDRSLMVAARKEYHDL